VYGQKKGRTGASAEEFLELWAAQKRKDGAWAEESMERHRRFLIASMMQGKEGVRWEKTPLWKYLEGRFGELVREIGRGMKAALGGVGRAQRASRSGTPASQAGTKRKRGPLDEAAEKRENVGDTISVRTRSATVDSGAESDLSLSRIRTGRSNNHTRPTAVSTPKGKTVLGRAISEEDSDGSEPAGAARKGKSILRPRQSKYVPKLSVGDGTEERIEEPSSPVRPLALASAAVKLPKTKNNTSSKGPQKRSTRLAMHDPDQASAGAADVDVDEGIDMSLDGAEEDGGVDQSETLRGASTIPLRLRAEDFAPRAQGDTWICPLDGCLHKVYAASDPASQMLIKEHYRSHVHDDDADMRMQLVKRMEAPGLPVNRLMGLIQMRSGQRSFPAPIVRRY